MNVGERIKEILDEDNLRPSDFADKLGKSRQYASQLLKSDSINTKTLFIVLDALNVSPAYFFNDNNEVVGAEVKKPKYIEQRLDELEKRLKKIEKKCENT